MKNFSILALIQAVLALICGILMSKMSFIGRMGINFLHRDYAIFKTWWKTALLIFAIQLTLLLLLSLIRYFTPAKTAKSLFVFLLLLGFAGAYLTYVDFTTTSHKMMKGSFHSGGYLFWLGWTISSLYFLFWNKKKRLPLAEIPLNKQDSSENEPL
ncbi:cytochrome d ubiquinol oxidase subunit II [Flavobacterium sp. JP2137]|uniref:cytochrome d ubiquinol oxidase subunit II n=1 Tax=Flavobacterium sp. JP2137 TaxID=3414510 RepID=UPI003D2FB753